ncbi:hypothetical protein LSS_21125 [Leptospira santarosai serovar Shermani str. LT 821]|uniref:Uncharacterized protein n=1 Tax=Leptospira santarosai serovar Shermani str. LT 821 TaxID=758847 RepID=A0A097ESD0_9LEPT|nr:hypothetical protein LSS_21125 [Leptospira santarosai serovar Shermani str. LT 821]
MHFSLELETFLKPPRSNRIRIFRKDFGFITRNFHERIRFWDRLEEHNHFEPSW